MRTNKVVNEKWYVAPDSIHKFWYSDSRYQFLSFLKNIPTSGISGWRFCIADDCYLAGAADKVTHEFLVDYAKATYLVDDNITFDKFVCGCPNYAYFDSTQWGYDIPEDMPEDESKECVEAEYDGLVCIDCGFLEVLSLSHESIDEVKSSSSWPLFAQLCKDIYIINTTV